MIPMDIEICCLFFNQLIEGGLYNEKNIISHSRIGNDIFLIYNCISCWFHYFFYIRKSYGNHTVTYYGYNIYKKSGSSDKLYLRVNDNWGTSARYVDTTYIGSLGHTLFEICRVIP